LAWFVGNGNSAKFYEIFSFARVHGETSEGSYFVTEVIVGENEFSDKMASLSICARNAEAAGHDGRSRDEGEEKRRSDTTKKNDALFRHLLVIGDRLGDNGDAKVSRRVIDDSFSEF
jgi:hypothetical protein